MDEQEHNAAFKRACTELQRTFGPTTVAKWEAQCELRDAFLADVLEISFVTHQPIKGYGDYGRPCLRVLLSWGGPSTEWLFGCRHTSRGLALDKVVYAYRNWFFGKLHHVRPGSKTWVAAEALFDDLLEVLDVRTLLNEAYLEE